MKPTHIPFLQFSALLLMSATNPCHAQEQPSSKKIVNRSDTSAATSHDSGGIGSSHARSPGVAPSPRSKSKALKMIPDRMKLLTSDFKIPRLLSGSPSSYETFELGDGFKASVDGNSIIVAIPGAYMDGLTSGRANTLIDQLAGTIYIKLIDTAANSLDQAFLERFYLGSKIVDRAGDDVRTYSFKARNGRVAKIFVYLNELSGVTGVVEMVGKESTHQ